MTHPEIESEQAYLDRAHERLDAMRDAARALSAEVVGEGAGGTFANRLERDIRVELSGRRLAQLNIGDASVCFGRLDYLDGLRAYVGRIGVSDEDGEQLVVDWRAPVAEPFYRATPAEPLGVGRRRHFSFRGRRIAGIDDELLSQQLPGNLVLVGEAALLAGLERARTGRMQDIVATIQAEQDAVIRSELAGILVVQGGPGTGKTAVALHRAAYLLFTHRQRLERDGVLLVGPSTVFLRYIEQVLPSLGEHTVALATPGELYAGSARVGASEPDAVAALKGDLRMAEVVARAVATRERPLRHPLTMSYGRHELTLGVGELRRVVETARQRGGTHNARRSLVERLLARAFVRAWRQAEDRSARHGDRLPVERDEQARVAAAMPGELRRNPSVRAALERMWPLLTPEELLHDLFGAAPLLHAAANGVLSEDEERLLLRQRSAALSEITWTVADMALLDEAAQLLGPARRPGRRRGGGSALDGADAWMLERILDDAMPDCPACDEQLELAGGERPWHCPACDRRWRDDQVAGPGDQTHRVLRDRVAGWASPGSGPILDKGARVYGHVVVDEAQGLSPMQWRAISRRCPSGSFTVVGDLGQASASRLPADWHEALSQLRSRSGLRVEELTVNYRTPAEVMAVAAEVLAEAAPSLTPPRSVREAHELPELWRVGALELLDEAVSRGRGERAAMTARSGAEEGKVALIAPRGMLADLAHRLEAPVADGRTSLSASEARRLLDAPLAVLGLEAARGLEFDSVVLVEPAALVAEHAQGLRALYVALTRTTRRLVVVYSEELPHSLERGLVLARGGAGASPEG
ncbi:MAG TPA: ATP-binding domain-containing protein [Acidimicrobiales bacterium]|nr:ATP-binding domain-containing protein [Acidimicrobiales bacterium]